MEEETWHQKSQMIWLMQGDQNTNFVHSVVNQRRATNIIWEWNEWPISHGA